MNKNILFNCTIKIEDVWFHLSLDKSFFESSAFSVSLHNHADYEVHIIESGTFAFQIDGREYILRSGNCLLIGPNVYHSKGNALTEDSRRHSFKFECSANEASSEIMGCINKINGICLLENAANEISMVDALITAFQTRQTGYRTYIDNLFAQLILAILRDVSGHTPCVEPGQLTSCEENRSAVIDEFFAQHCMSNAHAEELACLLCLSVRQLNRIMIRFYGVPFKQKLLQMKIIAAKDLLADTTFTINRIAEITGYNNTGYFISTFKKFTGMTPEQFRKMKLKKQ
jgi:AraC-like DNA-binding protein